MLLVSVAVLYMYAMFFFFLLCCVFFQAEDGIRDLVRSRGLGDVYKRQLLNRSRSIGIGLMVLAALTALFVYQFGLTAAADDASYIIRGKEFFSLRAWPGAVSYTHLTLPTSDLV